MSKTLLIVDDSAVTKQSIRNHFRKLRRQWSIYDSDNAIDAMEMIGNVKPDYVTMDVQMPKMSGIEAAERIRALWPEVRVVLITANIQDSTVAKAKELGVGFIEKPITVEKISRAVAYFEAPNEHV